MAAKGFRFTHCRRGHEFTPENTYTQPNGQRTCRICSGKSARKKKTHCKRGHPRTPENLTVGRSCKLCMIERNTSHKEEDRPYHNAYSRQWLATHPLTAEQKKRQAKRGAKWAKNNPVRCRLAEHKHRTSVTGNGGYFTPEEWFTLCFAVGFKCLCCGEKKPLEADHVIPVSKGGTSWLWNIQPLCRNCNARKGIKSTDYRYTEETQQCKQNILSELRATAHTRMGLENPLSRELRCSVMAAGA